MPLFIIRARAGPLVVIVATWPLPAGIEVVSCDSGKFLADKILK
jgi:hypothetical protein